MAIRRRAQSPFTELQQHEAAEFARAVPPAQAAVTEGTEGSFLLKLERVESA